MSELERWEGRYAGADYAFGKEPNYFLASCKGLLPKSGRVLVVADGEGRNGVWLAEQGLDVLSIDFRPQRSGRRGRLRPNIMSPLRSSRRTFTPGTIQKPRLTWWWKFSPSSARHPNEQ